MFGVEFVAMAVEFGRCPLCDQLIGEPWHLSAFAKSRQAISPSSVKAYSFKNACICELGPVKQSISFFRHTHTHRHAKTMCSAASFAVRGLGRAAAALRTSFLPERPEDTVSRSDVDDIIRTTLSCRSSVQSQGPALGN